MCHLLPLTVIKALQSLLVDDIQPDISLGWLWIKVPGRRRQWLKLKPKLSAPFERRLFYCATTFNECHFECCFESLHCHHHRHQFLHLFQLLGCLNHQAPNYVTLLNTVAAVDVHKASPLFSLFAGVVHLKDGETACWWQLMMTVCPVIETRLLNRIRILQTIDASYFWLL